MLIVVENRVGVGDSLEVVYDPETGLARVTSRDDEVDIDMDLLVQSLKTIKTVTDNKHKRKR